MMNSWTAPAWRRIGTVVVLLLAGLTATSDSLSAQTPDQAAAVLLRAAIQFEQDEMTDIATAIFRLILREYPNTSAGAEARTRLAGARESESASSGRTELKVWSTLYGLWLGVAIPGAFNADGSEPYGLGLLVGGPAGYLTGKAYGESRPISIGQARAITWGGTWGTWQGMGWAIVAEAESEGVFGAMIGTGLAGVAVGGLLSHREISDGLATTINLGSLWGSWFGVAGGVLGDLEGDELLAATLIAGNVGLVTTAVGGRNWNLSRSRARLISVAGVIGGLGGAGIDMLVQPDDEKVAIAIPLVGSILGLAIGARRTRDRSQEDGAQDSFRSDSAPLGALLNWSAGEFSLGTPLPVPVTNGVDRAMNVPVLRIRF